MGPMGQWRTGVPARSPLSRSPRRFARRRSAIGSTILALAVALTGLTVLVGAPAQAAVGSFTWDAGGGANTNWSNPLNWVGDVVPSGTAVITFNDPGAVIGGGVTTYDLAPSALTIQQVFLYGTWQVTGAQIAVTQGVYTGTSSQVTLAGGLSGDSVEVGAAVTGAAGATIHIPGPIDVTTRLRLMGPNVTPATSTISIEGTAPNHVAVLEASHVNVPLSKPAGVAAARHVQAVAGGTVTWMNDRQVDLTPAAQSPFGNPTISAVQGQIKLNGHAETAADVIVDTPGKIDLGGGTLTAEKLGSGDYYGGRTDIVNGTFRFNPSPTYWGNDWVWLGSQGSPVDLRMGAKLTGAAPVTVEGVGSSLPILRLADAATYTGALKINAGTVCAATGTGGAVTQSGGAYIDERTAPCVAVAPKYPPAAPGNFTATGGDSQVTLSWWPTGDTGSAPLSGYKIYRVLSGGSTQLLTSVGPTVTSFVDTGRQNGTTYAYQLSAYTADGESPKVDASATPHVAMGAPTLTAVAGDSAVRLSWTPPNPTGGQTGFAYKILRSDDVGNEAVLYPGGGRAYLDDSLTNGTTYHYTVVPMVSGAIGSNEVVVTPSADAGALQLAMRQTGPAYPGRTTTLQLTGTNKDPATLSGPFVATLMLPASTFQITQAGGSGGWICQPARLLGGRQLVTCIRLSPLAGTASLPALNVIVKVPTGAARASYPISYSMAAAGRAVSTGSRSSSSSRTPSPPTSRCGWRSRTR